jgi:hypothetical protein
VVFGPETNPEEKPMSVREKELLKEKGEIAEDA